MAAGETSIEARMVQLQKLTKCPYAESRLFIFAQAMDPYRRHQIALECPAKRRVIPNAAQWKVFEAEIKTLCCDAHYATICEWYQAATRKP